ncbi:hypothetical protein ACS0TY_015695 [Phlomoides rotata]
MFLENESGYMPDPGYLKLVESDEFITSARFKAVNFIIKVVFLPILCSGSTQRRMGLSDEIVFTAVNYLDRFISLDKCQEWKSWMFELLSVACLTVASKFNGTTSNFVNEFQMNHDLENSFAPSAIQKMELNLMTALGWRMNSTTPFSYIHLIVQRIHHDSEDLTQRVTELLLNALLDPKFLEFKQSVIAISAIRCIVEEELSESGNVNASLANLVHTIVPQEQKDNVIKCVAMMEQVSGSGSCWGGGPSSPVTVLKEEVFSFCDSGAAADVEKKSSRKRKMEERDCIDI